MAEYGTVGRSSIDSLLNWSSPPPADGPGEVRVGTSLPGSVDGGTTVLTAGAANGGSSPASPQDSATNDTSGDPGRLVEAGSSGDQTAQASTVDDQSIPPDQAGPAVDQIPPDQAGPADGQGDPATIEVHSDQLSVGPETVDDVTDGEPGSVDPQAAEGDPAWEPSDADESADPDGTSTSDDATEDPNAPQNQDDTGNQDDTNDPNGTDTGDQGDTSDPQTDPGSADGQDGSTGSQTDPQGQQDPGDSQTDPGGQTDPTVPDGQDGSTVPEIPSTDPPAGGGGTEDPGSGTPETPTPEVPTPEVPTADLPAAETPAAGTPSAETPAADMPSAETPTGGLPSANTPSAETPNSTGGGGGGGGGDDQGKGGDQTGSTDTTGLTKDSKFAEGGVGGGWRKARPEVMEKLGKQIAPSEDGKGDTPGDHLGAAEHTARNIDIGFPGFGVVGLMLFGPSYSSARSSAADYLKSAKNQLGAWDGQLREGANVIRQANDKSTAKN